MSYKKITVEEQDIKPAQHISVKRMNDEQGQPFYSVTLINDDLPREDPKKYIVLGYTSRIFVYEKKKK